ncbi:hypothetical protein CYLTODRAFT_376717 [Cylindrobasidium torrendii FP15055 ss-10]|uniref:Uncharacterized protein n=1 Tax=Cylindrobasidium torrendii FP15055 ss-10 TaxID=1314674 RepID=A0A0D7BAD8_9AGAR|nr:hypothetical protein CYLTODRAFT_376717 [Cylindrobasidium torrendii FP15055 ss-10]
MVVSDKRLLWDPRHGKRFVVGGGTQLTMYEWAPDQPEIRLVTAKHDLEFMKCFAWSPDPIVQDLIAVGSSTGHLDLFRLESSKQTRHSSSLSTGPLTSLPVRNQRAVNALSFCTADPNYLAVGLDKVRGDCSLVVWDIASTVPSLIVPTDKQDASTTIARPQPLLPRPELAARVDNRILQQHAPTDVVSALTFLPQTTSLILASMSSRYLRLFDLRNPNQQAANINLRVTGMSPDPFDPRRVACYGDGSVTVWDTRTLAQPILSFSEKDAAADGANLSSLPYSAVEFSSTRRGTLATLQRGSKFVRMWDVMEASPQIVTMEAAPDADRGRDSSQPSQRLGKRSWAANLPWPGSASSSLTDSTKDHPVSHIQTGAILTDTRRSKTFHQPLSSFALVPSENNVLTTNLMVVNSNGDLEYSALYDTPKQASWSARGDLALGAGFSYRIVSALPDEEVPPEPWDIPAPLPHAPRSAGNSQSRGRDKPASREPATTTTTTTSRSASYNPSSRRQSFRGSSLAADTPQGRSFSPSSLRMQDTQMNKAEFFNRSISRSRKENVRLKPALSPDTRAPVKPKKQLKGIAATIEEDVSMMMRRRALSGYGLTSPSNNSWIILNTNDSADYLTLILADLWKWIAYTRNIICHPSPIVNGFDFSFDGLYNTWEGHTPRIDIATATPMNRSSLLPPDDDILRGQRTISPMGRSHGDLNAALKELLARGGLDATHWTPSVHTAKPLQRQVALLMIGWSMKEHELAKDIERWVENGKLSRAACWAVFTRRISKAVDILLHSEDENHQMMSGMLAALAGHISGRSGGLSSVDLREHCERMIVKLQDPYLRVILTHLALGDWMEVLEEELLPFRERLAIAFQFLDDKSLSSYLSRVKDRQNGGAIDAIMVTGLRSKAGVGVVQAYVDTTGDIQTAAVLASFVSPARHTDKRAERWIDSYRDLLDGFRLFHHRVEFDVSRGKVVQEAVDDGYILPKEWAPKHILLRCNYCNRTMSGEGTTDGGRPYKPTVCPHCARPLPRCSVCLMSLSIIPDIAREMQLRKNPTAEADTLEDAIVMCQTCRHGGHASHIMDWFFVGNGAQSHTTCAVASCDCPCADQM